MGRRGHQHDERHQRRQFAGLSLIFGGGTLFETALTQFVINLRYALMSLSLSQKLERRVGLIDRMLFSFMMTDEVFAVASGQKGEVGKRYLFGVMIAPYCGWALGTLCGAVASGFLPPSVRQRAVHRHLRHVHRHRGAVAKQSRAVLGVVALAVALSCAMHWVPVLNTVSSGFSIILAPCWRRAWARWPAPVPDEPSGAPDGEVA